VSFSVDVIANTNDLSMTLTQHLHLMGDLQQPMANVCRDEDGLICWPIPVVEIKIFPTDGEPFVVNHSLHTNSKVVVLENIPGSPKDAVFLVNASHRGYFAVAYSTEQWGQILPLLPEFNASEILGLLIEAAQMQDVPEGLLETLISHGRTLSNLDIEAWISRIQRPDRM
jgi:hypothetical protein